MYRQYFCDYGSLAQFCKLSESKGGAGAPLTPTLATPQGGARIPTIIEQNLAAPQVET